MESHMADDVALWCILAAIVGWVCCGCVFTARNWEQQQQRSRQRQIHS
jgi:hypothetical protein